MGEYACVDEWNLQAIVRAGCTDFETWGGDFMGAPSSCFGLDDDHLLRSMDEPEDLLIASEIIQADTRQVVSDELRELYKPFYPVLHPLSPQTIFATSMSLPKEFKHPQNVQKKKLLQPLPSGSPHEPKAKKGKKNQQKKMVKHVTADDLTSDMWAWRKYGQKPIKGSPYPRSYYRCSSSKGCLARKQVERSREDPTVFVITYTAEHSHGHPTKRNSLAGSTRIKSSIPKMPATPTHDHHHDRLHLSPPTPSAKPIEYDHLLQQQRLKQEEEQIQTPADFKGCDHDLDISIPDITFSDELFPSLESLSGMAMEFSFDGCFSDY